MSNTPDTEYVIGEWGLYPSQWEITLKGRELQSRRVAIMKHLSTGNTNK